MQKELLAVFTHIEEQYKAEARNSGTNNDEMPAVFREMKDKLEIKKVSLVDYVVSSFPFTKDVEIKETRLSNQIDALLA